MMASSTRHESDLGIRALAMQVMPRLRRAASRTIVTWYPVHVTVSVITFQVAILVLRRKSVVEPVFLPWGIRSAPSRGRLWVSILIGTSHGDVDQRLDQFVKAGAGTLVLI